MRGDIAGDARVGILSPRPAKAIGLLVNCEVVETGLLQPDGTEDARHPCSNDEKARTGGSRLAIGHDHVSVNHQLVYVKLRSVR